jgi:hypothetical protein
MASNIEGKGSEKGYLFAWTMAHWKILAVDN